MMRMRLLIGMMIVAGLALMLRLMTLQPAGPAGSNQPAPDVALPLKKNSPPTKLSEFKGKVVVLDFWATWCGPCKMSIPELVNLQAQYGERGLQVIGVSVDHKSSQQLVPVAQKELGMNYPVVLMDDVPGMDRQFAFESIPTLYIIDKKGMVREIVSGYDPNKRIAAKIAPLLKE